MIRQLDPNPDQSELTIENLWMSPIIGVRFRPALVRYDGFSLLAARDPNIVISSRFIQG